MMFFLLLAIYNQIQDSFISNTNIGYQLSEDLSSGKVKFINTTDSTEEEVDLTGNDLSSGVRSLAALTNAPTLINGKTYTIEINGTDLVGNDAVIASITGLKYEVPSSKLDALTTSNGNIKKNNGSSFTSNDTGEYELKVGPRVQEITLNPTKNNGSATIEYLDDSNSTLTSPFSIVEGNNTIKVKVTSSYDSNDITTYTLKIEKKNKKFAVQAQEGCCGSFTGVETLASMSQTDRIAKRNEIKVKSRTNRTATEKKQLALDSTTNAVPVSGSDKTEVSQEDEDNIADAVTVGCKCYTR